MLKKHVINILSHNNVSVDRSTKKLIKKCIRGTLDSQRVNLRCVISVIITDNSGIQDLNLQFRNIDSPTDVLSFPSYELIPGKPINDYIDIQKGKVYLGDIAISAERAERQAKDFGHSSAREVGYLSVHSTLHLLGYDHMNDADKKIMRIEEKKVLQKLHLFR